MSALVIATTQAKSILKLLRLPRIPGAMSNPPSAAAAMGPPSVAAVARTTQAVVAHSAGPLGQTQAQGLKRAFEGM